MNLYSNDIENKTITYENAIRRHSFHRLYKKLCCIALCTAILVSVLSGCGKPDEALETFQADMNDFTAAIKQLDTDINNINPTSDDAVKQLLAYYDEMEDEFLNLTTIAVPEDYDSIPRLSQKAYDYMVKAISYYHVAFESEPLDQDILNAATAYYEKAFEFVGYIGQVLMGAEITFQSDIDNTENQNTENQ